MSNSSGRGYSTSLLLMLDIVGGSDPYNYHIILVDELRD
jgi:hypothetical protein